MVLNDTILLQVCNLAACLDRLVLPCHDRGIVSHLLASRSAEAHEVKGVWVPRLDAPLPAEL